MSYSKRVCSFVIVTLAVASFAAAQSRFPGAGGFDTGITTRTIDTRTIDRSALVIQGPVEPHLQIDGRSDKVNTCEPKITIAGRADFTYHGTFTYTWTLYRNGQQVGNPSKQTITCPKDAPVCEPPWVNFATPSVTGFRLTKHTEDRFSPGIKYLLQSFGFSDTMQFLNERQQRE